jgi:Family of unknown function (DUF6193)
MAAARRRGPADAVEAQWLTLRLRWQWMTEAHEIRSPGAPYPRILALLEAAAAEPRLRRLYPFTSHFTLAFSSSTTHPWVLQAVGIEPRRNGAFRVRTRHAPDLSAEIGTAEQAVALAVEALPPGPGPTITNSAGSHHT